MLQGHVSSEKTPSLQPALPAFAYLKEVVLPSVVRV